MNHTRTVIVWRMVLAGLAIIGSVACLVPSAMMNIRVRQEMGGDLSVALACIAAVALAAACIIVAENSWKHGQYQRLLWCAPVFAILFAFNISNAIGLAGANRSAFTEPRTVAVQALHSLRARLETMKGERGAYRITAGGSTPGMIKAAISARQLKNQKVWNRTGQCRDVTLDVSGAFCAELAFMKAKFEAAKKVEALDADIAAINARIAVTPVYTETEHPHIKSMIRAYGTFWPVTDQVREQIRIGSDMLFGFTVEIIAAFGPSLLVFLLWPETPMSVASKPRARAKSQPKEDRADDLPRRFLADCVTVRKGSNVPSSDLYSGFKVWCIERKLTPISQTAFGKQAGKVYQKKRIDNRTAYLDIELKNRLKLVAAHAGA